MMLSELRDFNNLLLRFQQVERAVSVPGRDRYENDTEHSYQLAMLAWHIIERDKLPLDISRAVRYALVHDLVEVYAGDTLFYASEHERTQKKKREADAARRLKSEFPDMHALHEYIHGYETRADPEARFIWALDKLIPCLNIFEDGGRLWHEHNVTFQMLVEKKQPIFAVVPELAPYFEELVSIFEQTPELFPAP